MNITKDLATPTMHLGPCLGVDAQSSVSLL